MEFTITPRCGYTVEVSTSTGCSALLRRLVFGRSTRAGSNEAASGRAARAA